MSILYLLVAFAQDPATEEGWSPDPATATIEDAQTEVAELRVEVAAQKEIDAEILALLEQVIDRDGEKDSIAAPVPKRVPVEPEADTADTAPPEPRDRLDVSVDPA